MSRYQEEVSEVGALFEMFNALIYVLVRYKIKPFAEPVVIHALESVSKLWFDTADSWLDDYKATLDAVKEAENG